MGKYNNLFAHIIIEPMGPGRDDEDGKGTASFLATYGCLARVENVSNRSFYRHVFFLNLFILVC